MDYGISIPDTAQKIQDNTRQALKNMTALEINEINVHIVGVQIEAKEDELVSEEF